MQGTKKDSRIAVVTGAGRGLGRAAATLLARHGFSVLIADVNGESAEQVASELSAYGRARAAKVEVSRSVDVREMVEGAVKSFGGLDVLVHCAGVSRGATQMGAEGWLPAEEVCDDDWEEVIRVNLTGTFYVNREAAKVMIPAGGGRIVNVASISGLVANKGLRGLEPYNASKGGVIALTKSLAAEWAPYGITVNCISPGYMATEMGTRSQSMPGFKQLQHELTPLGRLGKPEEFAQAVAYLASDAAGYVTGHNLVIDGGYTAW